MLITSIPDFYVEVQDIIADKDMVVSRWQAKGVFSKELFGVLPSNETFEFSGMSWTRIVYGSMYPKMKITPKPIYVSGSG